MLLLADETPDLDQREKLGNKQKQSSEFTAHLLDLVNTILFYTILHTFNAPVDIGPATDVKHTLAGVTTDLQERAKLLQVKIRRSCLVLPQRGTFSLLKPLSQSLYSLPQW